MGTHADTAGVQGPPGCTSRSTSFRRQAVKLVPKRDLLSLRCVGRIRTALLAVDLPSTRSKKRAGRMEACFSAVGHRPALSIGATDAQGNHSRRSAGARPTNHTSGGTTQEGRVAAIPAEDAASPAKTSGASRVEMLTRRRELPLATSTSPRPPLPSRDRPPPAQSDGAIPTMSSLDPCAPDVDPS